MYTSLVNNIFDNNRDDPIFVEYIKKNINNIFVSSTRFIPNVMSAFLDIALAQKNNMQFQPDTISNVCQSGGLLSLGTLLIEEYLISNENLKCEAKRSRSENAESLHWVKLAEYVRYFITF